MTTQAMGRRAPGLQLICDAPSVRRSWHGAPLAPLRHREAMGEVPESLRRRTREEDARDFCTFNALRRV